MKMDKMDKLETAIKEAEKKYTSLNYENLGGDESKRKFVLPEHHKPEMKTRRVQLVFTQSMYDQLLADCKLHGYPSFNDFCTTILGAYLEEGDDE